MRIWAEVYDTSGAKVAFIDSIISANAASRLDEAGTFDLQCALQQDVVDYLVNGNEIALYAQEDTETPVQWTRGKIVKPRYQETADNLSISISGRDLMDELRMVVVGLGRSYNAQTVQTIMDDLVGLVDGWTASVETASASLLQTARFDGAKVLKAILQSTKQLGLHIRNGTVNRTLEIGAFGTAATTANGQAIWAMRAPSSITPELYSNNNVLIIDTISVTEDLDPSVNWAIPMGAGEGTAATTLKDTSYEILNTDNTVYRAGTTPTYPIYIRTNDFGIDEYYIDASDGDDQRQDTLSFKTIGPIANSSTAKQLASDALAKACMASLARTRVALTSYTLTVRKLRVDVRPGDLIHVQYKGVVPTTGDPRATRGTLTYIDVDEDLWVMGVQRSASESGFVTTLQVSTIDQHVKDDSDILVEVLDRTEVQNLSVQTFPFMSERSSVDYVGWDWQRLQQRPARFSLKIDSKITDLIQVTIRFKSRPLTAQTRVQDSSVTPFLVVYELIEGDQHPKGLQLWINGVNVSSAFGGPWNNRLSGTPGIAWTVGQYENNALDVTCDITSYILNASGGMYRDHLIEFYVNADRNSFEYKVPGEGSNTNLTGDATSGSIECNFNILGVARPLSP